MKILLLIAGLFWIISLSAQPLEAYQQSYDFIHKMLRDEMPLSFKDAVWATENAYENDRLDIKACDQEIEFLTQLCGIISNTELIAYTGKDKDVVTKHAALFKTLMDTVSLPIDSTHILFHLPYTYDFDDPTGQKDWTKMFVSKLLKTGKGNCHSLPYLYKILSDELGIPCYLAFAPNHIYIKLYAENTGWYNTELTSASFPIDAWIIASGYVAIDAIRNGLYMDTLSNKQAVANCLLDLAQGYQHKYGKENPEFVIQCCNTVLEYHPTNVNALLTKAEAQKQYIHSLMKTKNLKKPEELFSDPMIKEMFSDMESTYIQLHKWGYRRMPEEMYRQWMGLLKNEPNAYTNQKLKIPK
ncbi:MAG: hypothetical protein FWF52_07355 [Candidatus Azobacteroides sp.]|nr:hypothetical protein [Candidatus Azobacteroides sp.]